MADTPKRLIGPTQSGTADNSSAYTVPALTTTIVRSIHVSNPTGSAVTVTVAVGTTATAANRFLDAFSVPAGNTFDWSGFLVLAAAEVLNVKVGTATAVTITVSGVEVT